LCTDHEHNILVEMRVEIARIDGVIDVALLDDREARHCAFHFLRSLRDVA